VKFANALPDASKVKSRRNCSSDLYPELAPLDTLRNFFYAPTVEMKITFELLRQGGYAR
jgi:hypothetical protein